MRKLIKSVFLVSVLFSSFSISGQELKINNVSLSEGEFSYSRGDSIIIAGENDTVRIDSAMIMDLKGPKLLLSQTSIITDFASGSFKAFYDSYEKLRVEPLIQTPDSTTLGEIRLNIRGGQPPYEIKWLSFLPEDSMLFANTIPLIGYNSYFDYLSDIHDNYSDTVLTNCLSGVYSCTVEDMRTTRHFSFVVGNQNDELSLTNCSIIEGDVVLPKTYNWSECGLIYERYLNEDWTLGFNINEVGQSLYSIGVDEDTLLLDNKSGLCFGVHIDNGFLFPIVDDSIYYDKGYSIEESDGVKIISKGGYTTVYLNETKIVTRINDEDQSELVLKSGICSGTIGNLQVYMLDDIVIGPAQISPNVNFATTDLICGLNYSGSICSSRPGLTVWPTGFNGSSGCITGLPAGTYTIGVNPPFGASYSRNITIGYEAVWEEISGLESFGMSGLQNTTSSVGDAKSSQTAANINDPIWAEFSLDYDEFGGSIVLGLGNGIVPQAPMNSIYVVLTIDPVTNQIFVTGIDENGVYDLGIAPLSSKVVRITANQTHWGVIMDGLYSNTVLYNMQTPSLQNVKACVQLSQGNNVVTSVITSFGCEEIHNYTRLSKQTDGQLIPVKDQTIYFAYEESYLDDGFGAQLELTKYSGNESTNYSLTFNPEYGYKEYEIDISAYGFNDGDIGVLTMSSEKGEKWFLKFRIEE